MSQQTSKATNPETRKKILLGVLFGILAIVLYWQLFAGGGDDAPAGPANTTANNGGTRPSPTPRPTPRAGGTPEIIVSQPLTPVWLERSISSDGTGRNIFVYPTPTPIPPPTPGPPVPTPPPPPITLFSLNPQGVIARTGEFNMTLFGEKIPVDAQVFLDGRLYPATVVNEREIRVKVPADAIRAPGNPGVMVRSQADAKLYSNQLSLNIAAPPEPPYRFIGIIVKKDGAIAVLKSQADEEVISVVKGQKVGSYWRVLNITTQKIELENTNLRLSHVINYSGEGN